MPFPTSFAAFLAESEGYLAWPLALAIALVLLLIVRLRPRPRPEATADPVAEADAALRIRRAADKALVELAEVGREISGRIDTKVRILNRLSKEADAQIKRLEQLLQAAGRDIPPAEAGPNATSSRRLAARGEEISPAARELYERVLQLQREGKTLAEIARITRLSTQEIDLVLRLAAEKTPGG